VFGVKADPSMLLPLLPDGTFGRTLGLGRFIYITRDDVLMQAISLTKAQYTGAWTAATATRGPLPFNFDAIYRNVAHLTAMMGRWEAFFAWHGIAPLRLTYDAVDADIGAVMQKISRFLGVDLPATLRAEPKAHQRDSQSQVWRAQFLAALAAAATNRAVRGPS
jgi:LPS sulfotransferase NodH